jgi:hypothetical protein
MGKIYNIRCKNEACIWYNTDWVVTVLSDGTVPVRDGNQEKTFPAMPGMSSEKAKKSVEAIVDDEEDSGRRN